jgi:hypothetical protein
MSVTRIAVIKHPSGAVTRRAFTRNDLESAQDAAVVWLARTMRPMDGDEMVICYPQFDLWSTNDLPLGYKPVR